jgi:hypothetical protein
MARHQTSGSSTCVISPPTELQPISISHPQEAKLAGSHTSLHLSDTKGAQDDDSPVDLPSPTTHPAVKPERWNHPRSNLFKTMAAFWSFVVMGSNDAAYGALIPYVSKYNNQQQETNKEGELTQRIVARILPPYLLGNLARVLITIGGVHCVCAT